METVLPDDLLDQSSAQFDAAIEEAKSVIAQNADGFVVRVWDPMSDGFMWIFGHHRFPVHLSKSGRNFPDDTMAGRTRCSLDEFHAYLKAFYWPRGREMRAAAA